MSGVAGLRGVSASQDGRFTDKTKQLKQKLKFPKQLDTKITFSKVNLEVIREWIAKRVTALLNGVEDDVLIGYIFEMLEQRDKLDPKELQVYLTGFLEKNTGLFMKELWTLLAQAQESPSGIPQQILDIKAEELKNKEQYQEQLQQQLHAGRSQKPSNDHDRKTMDQDEQTRFRSKQEPRGRERRSSPPRRRDSYRKYKRERTPSPKFNSRHGYENRYESNRAGGRYDLDRKRGYSPAYKKRYRSKSPSPIRRRSASPRPKPTHRSVSPPRYKKQSLSKSPIQQEKNKQNSESRLKPKSDSFNGILTDGKNNDVQITEGGRSKSIRDSPDVRSRKFERSVSPIPEDRKPRRENAPSPSTDKDLKSRKILAKFGDPADLGSDDPRTGRARSSSIENRKQKKSRKEEKLKRKKHKKEKKSRHKKRRHSSTEDLEQNVDEKKGGEQVSKKDSQDQDVQDVNKRDVRDVQHVNKRDAQNVQDANKRDINDIVQEMKSIVEVEDLEALRQKALRGVNRDD